MNERIHWTLAGFTYIDNIRVLFKLFLIIKFLAALHYVIL